MSLQSGNIEPKKQEAVSSNKKEEIYPSKEHPYAKSTAFMNVVFMIGSLVIFTICTGLIALYTRPDETGAEMTRLYLLYL